MNLPAATPALAKTRKSRADPTQVVDDQWSRYTRARDNGHTDYLKMAKRCAQFYRGDQWELADRMKLEAEGRPALTINMILSTVNAVLGEHAANTVEFRYLPKVEGSEHTPGVMTKLATSICDANNYEWLEGQVFADAVIQDGRGFFDLRMKFDENLSGDVHIRSLDPGKVLIDPDASEYDPATWTEVFYTDWLSLDQIEATYGRNKREEVEGAVGQINTFGPDSVLWEDDESTFGDKAELHNLYTQPSSPADNRSLRLVRVVERQHIRMEPCTEFVDMMTGDTKPVPHTWEEARVMEFAAANQLGIIRRPRRKVRWTVTADHVLLHDDWSPYQTFTIIPYFMYWRRGKPFGLVRNLLSPQEQLNKLASQELHIINTTANSGWIIERNSLSGMTADDLRNQGAETGLVLEINPGKTPPEKIQPNRVPAGIERAALKSAEFIKTISGVNNAQLGFDNPEVSGVALKQKEMRGQVQLQVPLDNLQYTRQLFGRKLLELVQQFYTEQRTFKVAVAGMGPSKYPSRQQSEQEYVINQQTASGEVINNITLGKYNLSLSVIPSRSSFNDQQFAEVLNLRNVGVFIPDDRVIEYSHLAHKEELAEEIRALQGRGEMSEQQQQMEMFKQQVAQQMAVLELQKLAAEGEKLRAEAAAKLATLDPNSPEYEIERERLDAETQQARENLMLRRDLAMLDAKVRTGSDVTKLKGTLAAKERDSQVAREKNLLDFTAEQMKLRAQSKGIDWKVRKGT